MIKIDSLWLSVFADLAISLAATFYAVVIVAPSIPGLEVIDRFIVLTGDAFSGTLFLFLAHWLRELAQKHD